MRSLYTLTLVSFFLFLLPFLSVAEENPLLVGEFEVERVIDGDTIAVKGLKGSIRFLCIDTEECEKGAGAEQRTWHIANNYFNYVQEQQSKDTFAKYNTPMGWAGKEFAEKWFPVGSTVRVEYDSLHRKKGYYNRTLGYVFVQRNGQWVNYNVECVRAGMSPYFTKYGRSERFEQEFLLAERQARAFRRGVWSPYAMGYPNYDERIAAWDRRAQAIDRFNIQNATRASAITLLDEDDWERLPKLVEEEVVLLGTADPAGASTLSMSHKNDARLALVFTQPQAFQVASRLVTRSPDDFLVVKGLLQKGAGPAGGNYPWHVLVDTPPRYMIRPDDGQDLASTPDEISYELAEGEISWQDAPALMGEKVTVIGKIIRTNNIGEITFLNFHTNYQQTVTVVIEKENYSKFPQPPEKYYQGKTVRVRGTVSEYDAKPQIIVTDPKQIDVL
jgi:endonuclease YncB( thermonuclease family)